MYEYFEGWLTTKEWRTWKRYCIDRIKNRHSCSTAEARAMRDGYLRRECDFLNMTNSQVFAMFDSMIDDYIYWVDTPQGVDHWQTVSYRRRPIRILQTLTLWHDTNTLKLGWPLRSGRSGRRTLAYQHLEERHTSTKRLTLTICLRVKWMMNLGRWLTIFFLGATHQAVTHIGERYGRNEERLYEHYKL